MTVATIYSNKDTYVFSGSTQASQSATLSVGYDSKYGEEIALIQGSFSSIPATAIVSSAVFNVFVENAYGATPPHRIFLVTSAWAEATSGTTPTFGADLSGVLPATTTNWIAKDLTSTIRNWINGSVVNNGIAIRQDGTTTATYNYSSRESTATPSRIPYWTVTYTSPPLSTGAITTPVDGSTYNNTITLNCGVASDPDTPAGSLQYEWSYSANNGGSWTVIGLTVAGSTSLVWDTSALTPGTTYKVRVRAYDGTSYGPYTTETGTFSIVHTSKVKTWNGSAWVLHPLSRWDGTTWHTTQLKRWNGTTWISV